MSVSRTARRPEPQGAAGSAFVLYVEGASDCALIAAWARRVSLALARRIPRFAVILGGRRPARAVLHFRSVRAQDPAARGLCVLDRDAEREAPPPDAEPGLEFFTWTRRHIESYLLVPAAIGRSLRLAADDARLSRFFRTRLPAASDETALISLDAKRLFAPHGELARLLGQPVVPGRVARAMQESEFHDDVHELLGRLREAAGIPVLMTLTRVR